MLEAFRKVIFKEDHFSGRKSLAIFGGRPMPKALFVAFARPHKHTKSGAPAHTTKRKYSTKILCGYENMNAKYEKTNMKIRTWLITK